jgi:Tfp pilus assembly protein PilO
MIAAVVAVLITALYYVFLLQPKLAEISDTQRQTAQAREEAETLRNRLRVLEQARQNAPETMAKLNALRLLMPSTPDLPGLIRQVQEAADGSGVDLRSIQPSRPAPLQDATGVETINVNIAIVGGFRRIEDLLVRLETLQRIVEVRSISLAPGEQLVPGQIALSTTLTMRLYIVQENARVGSPPKERGSSSNGGTSE